MNENNKSMAKVILGGFAAACAVVGGVAVATYQVAKKAILNSYISDDEATKAADTIEGSCEEVEDQELRDLYGMDETTSEEPTEFGE